jgi:8-oxo-dGTP pyrophosphatase MutT (NUDIX family)
MYHSIIYDLVSKIQPYDSLEKSHIADTLKWIKTGAELCRVQSPATPPKHLVSYFVLFDLEKKKILLVDHKKAKLWLPSGGHVEVQEHPLNAAHRELQEELDVTLLLLHPDPLFLTVTDTIGATAGHTDVSLWYVYEADSTDNYNYDQEEFHRIRWFSLADLPLDRTDPHLERFCQKLLTSMKCCSH